MAGSCKTSADHKWMTLCPVGCRNGVSSWIQQLLSEMVCSCNASTEHPSDGDGSNASYTSKRKSTSQWKYCEHLPRSCTGEKRPKWGYDTTKSAGVARKGAKSTAMAGLEIATSLSPVCHVWWPNVSLWLPVSNPCFPRSAVACFLQLLNVLYSWVYTRNHTSMFDNQSL